MRPDGFASEIHIAEFAMPIAREYDALLARARLNSASIFRLIELAS